MYILVLLVLCSPRKPTSKKLHAHNRFFIKCKRMTNFFFCSLSLINFFHLQFQHKWPWIPAARTKDTIVLFVFAWSQHWPNEDATLSRPVIEWVMLFSLNFCVIKRFNLHDKWSFFWLMPKRQRDTARLSRELIYIQEGLFEHCRRMYKSSNFYEVEIFYWNFLTLSRYLDCKLTVSL